MQESNVADNQQATVTEIEKAWLAGIIDGEGSIRIDYPNGKNASPSPRVVVTNTDKAIIEKVADICKRLDSNPHVQTRNRKESGYRVTKDVLVLGVSKILIVLSAVMPYLTGRKSRQAILLHKFCEGRNKKDVNHLSNSQRMYSKEEISLIYEIKQAKYCD